MNSPTAKKTKRVINFSDYPTDKSKYEHVYEQILPASVFSLCEIGVDRGGSLRLWRDLYPKAEILGVDCLPLGKVCEEIGCRFVQGFQQDARTLFELSERGPWDVVIDDGDHIPEHQRLTWKALHGMTKVYVIEDIRPQDALSWKEAGAAIFPSAMTDEFMAVFSKPTDGPRRDSLCLCGTKPMHTLGFHHAVLGIGEEL